MGKLKITLLGTLLVSTENGRSLSFGTRKTRGLLARLAMAGGRPMQREILADLLWSRSGQKEAAASLSQALYALKRGLRPDHAGALVSDNDAIRLDKASFDLDVDTFISAAQSDVGAEAMRGLDLYNGPFLDGFSLSEPEFEAWVLTERSRLHAMAVELGTRLLEADREDNAEIASKLVAIDPTHEPAHRTLMRRYAAQDQRSLAISQFESCRDHLKRALDAQPSQKTLALFEAIKAAPALGGSVAVDPAEAPSQWKDSQSEGPPSPATVRRRTSAGKRLTAFGLFVLMALTLAMVYFRGSAHTPGEPLIAVLPLEVTKEGGSVDRFAFGVSDDITSELTSRRGLQVLARESAAQLAASPAQAAAFGVTHLFAGRMHIDGDRITLNAWISAPGSKRELWSKRYEVRASKLFMLEQVVVRDITAALTDEQSAAVEQPSTRFEPSQEAYRAFLEGLTLLHADDSRANATAVDAFRRALSIEPNFEKARSGLAQALHRASFSENDYAEALQLNWWDAYLSLKVVLSEATAFDAGRAMIESDLALRRRDYVTALRSAEAALQDEPGNAAAHQALAEVLIYSGNLDDAEAHVQRAIELNPAESAHPTFLRALSAFSRGQVSGAIEHIDRARDLPGHVPPELDALHAALLALVDSPEEARQALLRYEQSIIDRPRNRWRLQTVPIRNPRAESWQRPDLAGTVYRFPFAQADDLEILAEGLSKAGIGRSTLGYLPAYGNNTNSAVLNDTGIAPLSRLFVEDANGQRDDHDAAIKSQGTVVREGNGVCYRQQHQGAMIKRCAEIFVIPDNVPASMFGELFLATETGPIIVRRKWPE
ncbi:MAG: BTAD domain-containing putative transcriptional regulator [Silicimonas sp.]|jgi:DNA-binding SARP family transcriptional activator/TolB-like protein|uniref:BTAD domain-containing putative transcriptional regulator n=1 Tax=Roseitalea porphyridii TaxID=1852022 RepID=UPI0032EC342A